eukprot:COSAG01_NODE_1520_length_10029_cov_26.551374_5_plen_120_part_00
MCLGDRFNCVGYVQTAFALTKILLAEEWTASIQDAFGTSPGVNVSIALHEAQVAALRSTISPELLSLLSTSLPLREPEAAVSAQEAAATTRLQLRADDDLSEEELGEDCQIELPCDDDY